MPDSNESGNRILEPDSAVACIVADTVLHIESLCMLELVSCECKGDFLNVGVRLRLLLVNGGRIDSITGISGSLGSSSISS
jgi:hypothetical protein